MTLLFMDGADFYSAAEMTRKWPNSVTSGIVMTTGRFGTGQALRMGNNLSAAISAVFTNSATAICGFAWRVSSLNRHIFGFQDNGSAQVELRINSTGNLFMTRNGTAISSAGTTVYAINTWYYTEVKVTIDNSAGSFEVRVAEVVELSGSGLDTQNTANAYVNQLRFFQGNAGVNLDIDDVYFLNSSGGTHNDFLGDCRIETIYPSGAGNSTQFTPNTGSNFAAVDESGGSDSDTTYVASSTVGHKDTYTFGDLVSTTGSVVAVQPHITHRIDTSGTRSLAIVTRSGGSEADSSNIAVTSTSYTQARELQTVNPVTTSNWTISEINAAEFGIKVTA
jgi:hypothetical protein